MARIILLTPARRFIANRFGVGYQIPLNMVILAGPLVDAGHDVKLIDNDVYGWSHDRLITEILPFQPDHILIGHTGSTAAHTTCLATAAALKAAFPNVTIIYGGVYPTYAAVSTLAAHPQIDAIVRGEGEATIVDLINALECGRLLKEVQGIVYRDHGRILTNPPRPPIRNLDAYRPGWELVDWPRYELFGVGRAAGIQFSRGCPLTCTYCGQWMFWKKWRHRSSVNFVDQLRLLAEEYSVKIVWLADENFAADREATRTVLEAIITADLDLSLNINMTAADVVRDADLLPLYKAAGVDYVVMGIEALDDEVIAAVRKNNPFAISKQAVRLLREHDIFSLCNVIYGLEDESYKTLKEKFDKICQLDPDVLNAVYLTPHIWTQDGRRTDPAAVTQTDLAKWTYRNQVLAAPHLSPLALFAGVKLTEALVHLRPRALARLWRSRDKRLLKIRRRSLWAGFLVVLAEIWEFLFDTHFAPQGTLEALPDNTEIERGPTLIHAD